MHEWLTLSIMLIISSSFIFKMPSSALVEQIFATCVIMRSRIASVSGNMLRNTVFNFLFWEKENLLFLKLLKLTLFYIIYCGFVLDCFWSWSKRRSQNFQVLASKNYLASASKYIDSTTSLFKKLIRVPLKFLIVSIDFFFSFQQFVDRAPVVRTEYAQR